MEKETYDQWWQLHLRIARGENLDAAEQALYAAGLAALDSEEKMQWEEVNLVRLHQLREEIERLEATHSQLQAQRQHLDRQIWTLEGAYMSLTGLQLSSQSHVPSSV